MKIKFLKTGIVSTVFLILTLLILLVLRPVYLRITEKLDLLAQEYTELLNETTGLKISYESLSPSIFTGINIRGINIHDAETGARLLQRKKINASYSFSELLSANPVYALKTVTIDGVTAEYEKEIPAYQKLLTLLQSRKKTSEKKTLSLEDLELEIPFRVVIKNIALHYFDASRDLLVSISSASFGEQFKSRGLQVKTSGQINLRTDMLKTDGHRSLIACGFSVSGNLLNFLEGSSANVRFSPVSNADYTITRLDTLFNYSESQLHVRSVRSLLPYSLNCDFDPASKNFDLDFSAEKLAPWQFIRVKNHAGLYSKLEDSFLTCSAKVSRSDTGLDYGFSGKFELGDNLFGTPVVFDCSLDGDERTVNVRKFSASGEALSLDSELVYDIALKQPSGVITLEKLILKNGGMISTELYVDPLQKGFMCFSPQVFFDSRTLTALQLVVIPEKNSVDFTFDVDDYSHTEYRNNGHINIEGSYFGEKQKEFQASVKISDIFADSALLSGAFFMSGEQKEKLSGAAKSLEPYILSSELFFSTDFNDYTFVAPLCFFSNSRKDREILVFGFNGSKETLQLSQFDLQFGNTSASASASMELSDGFRDFSFTGDLTLNSLPYRFAGSFSNQWLAVSGDYNLNGSMSFDRDKLGSLSFDSLPVAFGKNIFSFSSDMNFYLGGKDDFSVVINTFAMEEASGNIAFRPKVVISGSASKYGLIFDTISYSDTSSVQQGSGSILWNLNDKIFDSIHGEINTSSPLSPEKIDFLVDFTNPSQLPLSVETLKNDFYLSASAAVAAMPMSRFSPDQGSDDICTADLSVSGTLANPMITANLQKFQMTIHGYPLSASGACIYDDTGLNVNDFEVMYSGFGVKKLNAVFDPAKFNGRADALFTGKYMRKDFGLPVSITMDGYSTDPKKKVPDIFNVLLHSDVSGELFPTAFPVDISLTKIPGRADIIINDGRTAVATMYDDGRISANSGKNPVVAFNLEGTVIGRDMNLNLSGLSADLAQFSKYINLVFMDFKQGALKGALKISGLTTDPEITGALTIEKPVLTVPVLSDKEIRTDRLLITAGNGSISLPQTLVYCGKGQCDIDCRVELDRITLNTVEANIKTRSKKPVPADMSFPMIHVKGNAGLDLNLLYVPGLMTVRGSVTAENATVEVIATALQTTLSDSGSVKFIPVKGERQKLFDVDAELNLYVGQKVQFQFNPLLRAVVAPDTPLSLYIDSAREEFGMKGNLTLRGGEAVWLNRNFYLKEGLVRFNETKGKIDPRITIRAETRERDVNGNRITIIMSANNQPLSIFNPVITSSPARSEREIMELLGQVVSADAENARDVVISGGDYIVQATVIRSIENTLRELGNFDIFSIRTNVLQNAVRQTMEQNSKNQQITFGNFFDNSTVYIGKYFGSSMYFDALMHWTYDETKKSDDSGVNGIVFQPEFGFEMASPYVNIRLGLAPDIEAMKKSMWIPSTSVTLSWKYSF
ncbi:MAG: translocation/assembly module TamB domain-containing protein [Treponema sp.]|nr:translocation/assembly module TamB domain-containing protein [Treponema sp.]